jgi:hypothetical protein
MFDEDNLCRVFVREWLSHSGSDPLHSLGRMANSSRAKITLR